MDFASPALTAVFIALVWTVIKTVTYFVDKKNGKNGHGLTDEQDRRIKEIERLSAKIEKNVDNLEELHNVKDTNHVPVWYVPAELLLLARDTSISLKMLNKELVETLTEIKGGQAVLVEKLTDLITSQRQMTNRLGDLINKLNAMSN